LFYQEKDLQLRAKKNKHKHTSVSYCPQLRSFLQVNESHNTHEGVISVSHVMQVNESCHNGKFAFTVTGPSHVREVCPYRAWT